MAKWLHALAALGFLGLTTLAVHGENYPAKTITIVVPASPGGVTDILARTLAAQLTKNWGQQVVVENKSGATNQIAAEYVAKSPPDGYTLFLSPEATFVIHPWLYSKLSYDPVKDFVPITGLLSISQALVVNPSVPVQNVKELIALAKAKPAGLNYGTYGPGSTGHLNMEMFQSMAGVKFVPVHYKGATPALTDVIGGHIQMMLINVSSAVQPWKTGQLKLLAIGSRKRVAQFPEIPTIAEGELPGFEAISWFGLFAPGGTAHEIVAKINTEVQQIFNNSEFREKFLAPNMFEPMISSPEQFSDYIKSDAQKWGKVIRDAKVKVD